jgi:Flp pilus assembly protein TadD
MNYVTAQILLNRNDLAQAASMVEKNLESVRTEHLAKREGGFLRLLGELQIMRNESENAINSLGEAIGILKEVGNPRQLWQAHASLGSGFDRFGRRDEARAQWARAAEVIHHTANRLSDRELRDGFLEAEPIRGILARAGR